MSCTGMEYPMITCIGGPRDTLLLYSVQVHESAHMWFPMQVGSDERRYAWQDEGLTRFNQAQGMRAFFKGYDRERICARQLHRPRATGGEVELMRHGDLYPFGTPAYGVASYDKMATNLVALRALLGDDDVPAAYRSMDYGGNKHPTPYDFFNTFNSSQARSRWFWRTWWYETWTLDQAITSARSSPTARRDHRGSRPRPDARSPRGDEGDGRVERRELPVDAWLPGANVSRRSSTTPQTITQVEIDPENAFRTSIERTTAGRVNRSPRAPGTPGGRGGCLDAVARVEKEMRFTRSARLALTVVLAIYGFRILLHPEAGWFMDNVDLPIHETGHSYLRRSASSCNSPEGRCSRCSFPPCSWAISSAARIATARPSRSGGWRRVSGTFQCT